MGIYAYACVHINSYVYVHLSECALKKNLIKEVLNEKLRLLCNLMLLSWVWICTFSTGVASLFL